MSLPKLPKMPKELKSAEKQAEKVLRAPGDYAASGIAEVAKATKIAKLSTEAKSAISSALNTTLYAKLGTFLTGLLNESAPVLVPVARAALGVACLAGAAAIKKGSNRTRRELMSVGSQLIADAAIPQVTPGLQMGNGNLLDQLKAGAEELFRPLAGGFGPLTDMLEGAKAQLEGALKKANLSLGALGSRSLASMYPKGFRPALNSTSSVVYTEQGLPELREDIAEAMKKGTGSIFEETGPKII